jgi:hypothetical protein
VCVPIAVDQAEDSIRVPAVIPETHRHTILSREAGRGAVVGVQRDVSMDRAGPRGRTARLYGSHSGDPHRIGLLRFEGSNSRHENSIIADGAGEAGNSLLTGRNAGLPQCSERLPSLSAEAKSSSAPVRLALGQE